MYFIYVFYTYLLKNLINELQGFGACVCFVCLLNLCPRFSFIRCPFSLQPRFQSHHLSRTHHNLPHKLYQQLRLTIAGFCCWHKVPSVLCIILQSTNLNKAHEHLFHFFLMRGGGENCLLFDLELWPDEISSSLPLYDHSKHVSQTLVYQMQNDLSASLTQRNSWASQNQSNKKTVSKGTKCR